MAMRPRYRQPQAKSEDSKARLRLHQSFKKRSLATGGVGAMKLRAS